MTTFREALTAAYGYSAKNQPAKIATEATEALNLMVRALRGIFTVAAHVNPEFFGKKSTVAVASGTWARPADAITVFRIELAGAEVVTVPQWDKAAEPGKPAVWRLGQQYYSAGNANDPVAQSLDFFYAKAPDTPVNLDSVVDSLWNPQLDPLLIYEAAIYLALKDGRTDDVAGLQPDRNKWAQLMIDFLQYETTNTVFRYGNSRAVDVPSLLKLLAGGAP